MICKSKGQQLSDLHFETYYHYLYALENKSINYICLSLIYLHYYLVWFTHSVKRNFKVMLEIVVARFSFTIGRVTQFMAQSICVPPLRRTVRNFCLHNIFLLKSNRCILLCIVKSLDDCIIFRTLMKANTALL